MLKTAYDDKRRTPTQSELDAVVTSHANYVAYRGGLRAQLAHANLNGRNLSGRNLIEADLSGASLVGANLSGTNLERASLYCADLRDCDLTNAKLTRADLRGASFNGAKLSFAVLDNADLRAATMMVVGENGIALVDRERRREGATAGSVDFSNCSLKGASFGHAKLDGANFSGALLHGANFKGARLTNVTFRDAVLTGVNMKELIVPPEALQGCVTGVSVEAAARFEALKAKLDSHQRWIATHGEQGAPAILDGEDLRPLRQLLIGRPLVGLSARRTIAVGLDFSGSQFQGAKFDGADFRDANFSGADLRGASLRDARLAHAKFDRANLGRLPLANGLSLAPDLKGAAASEGQFADAILDGKVSELGLGQAA